MWRDAAGQGRGRGVWGVRGPALALALVWARERGAAGKADGGAGGMPRAVALVRRGWSDGQRGVWREAAW